LEILHTVFISDPFPDGYIYNNEYFPEYGIQKFLEFSTDGGQTWASFDAADQGHAFKTTDDTTAACVHAATAAGTDPDLDFYLSCSDWENYTSKTISFRYFALWNDDFTDPNNPVATYPPAPDAGANPAQNEWTTLWTTSNTEYFTVTAQTICYGMTLTMYD